MYRLWDKSGAERVHARRVYDGGLPCRGLDVSSYVLTWRPLLEGQLAIGHKPGKALRAALEAEGCSLVVNLLSETEGRAKEGPRRARLPLAGARPPGPERDAEVRAVFARMSEALSEGGRVYLHCSAGLHRTGMVSYAFLRHQGFDREAAVALIRELRPLTADELTEARLAWGERFAAPGPR